jgi:hypothetical protein
LCSAGVAMNPESALALSESALLMWAGGALVLGFLAVGGGILYILWRVGDDMAREHARELGRYHDAPGSTEDDGAALIRPGL